MNIIEKNLNPYLFFILAIVFLILLVNYLDRLAIAFAITPIQQEFHLNNAQFGAIGGAFGIGYLIMTVGGGILVDKFKARRVLALSAVSWSLLAIVIGLATGFLFLFIVRILLGLAEGPAFPSLTRIIADWFSKKHRVKIMAVSLASVPFASVIGSPLISHLIIWLNWRVMYIILGITGLLLAIIWYVIYRDPPASPKKNLQSIDTHDTKLLFNPTLLANNIAYFAYGYLLFFALMWLPGYFEQTYQIDLKHVGWFLTLPWLLGTIFLILGGIISDKLLHKTNSIRIARSHVIWICQLCSALCFIPVILIHSLFVAILFTSLGVGFGLMPNAVFYSLNIDVAKERAATSLGIMNCFSAVAAIIAPWLTGILSHLTGNFNAAIGLLIFLTLCGVLGIIFFQHPKALEE